MGSGVFYVISNETEALSKFVGTDEPGFEECLQILEKFTHGNVPELKKGGYTCILTNEKRNSQLRIEDGYRKGGFYYLRISYVTWEQIVVEEE